MTDLGQLGRGGARRRTRKRMSATNDMGNEAAPSEEVTSSSPDKLEKFFVTCNKQLNKLNRLIDDLLDTTRIRAGKKK